MPLSDCTASVERVYPFALLHISPVSIAYADPSSSQCTGTTQASALQSAWSRYHTDQLKWGNSCYVVFNIHVWYRL